MYPARGRDRPVKGGQRAATPPGTATGLQVELDIGGPARGHDRIDGGSGQRRAAEIRVHDDAGRVDDRPQARGAERKGGDGVLGDLFGIDLTRARLLLRLGDNGFHQSPAQHSLGRGEPGIG